MQQIMPMFRMAKKPHILVVNLQELVSTSFFTSTASKIADRVPEWKKAILYCLNYNKTGNPNEQFEFFDAKHMKRTATLFFAQKKVNHMLHNINMEELDVAQSGKAENEGSIFLRFKIEETNVQLINMHLEHGDGDAHFRIQTIQKLLKEAFTQVHQIDEHDVVIVAGNMNFESDLDHNQAEKLYKAKEFVKMSAQD